MTTFTIQLDVEEFIERIESLDRSQRPEYIFENIERVQGAEENVLKKYTMEAKEHWQARCCALLEYSTIEELYEAALSGHLPKVTTREKEAIHRLAHALRVDATTLKLSHIDESIIQSYYHAEALLIHIKNKRELLLLYIDLPNALKKRDADFGTVTMINNKALALARELGDIEAETKVLNNLGRMSEVQHDFAGALEFYLRSLALIDAVIAENNFTDAPHALPDALLMPKTVLLFNIGNCKRMLGNMRDTVTVCLEALAYASRLRNADIGVHLHQLLARAYTELGGHSIALEHLAKAAVMAESLKSPLLIGQNKMLFALTLSRIGDYKHAIEYGLQAVDIYNRCQSFSQYVTVSSLVGGMMISAGEFERAESFLFLLLTLIEQNDPAKNFSWQKVLIYQNLARIAIHRNEWDSALSYLQVPLDEVKDESKPPILIVDILLVATDAFTGAGMYDKAVVFAERSLALGLNSNILKNQYLAHQQLAIIAEKKNEIDAAFYHYKEFHRIKEQVYNDESDKRNKNMIILLEENEAHRTVLAERLRRYELEEEIGQLSMSLVHLDQTFKEIQTTLRTTKPTNEHAEQVVQVLRSVVQASESALTMNSSKSYKLIDEQIEAKFPNLPRVKRELCRFIALGHSTKEIARLMGISVESVHTLRYRTRTQFGLKDSDSLDRAIKLALGN